MLSHRHSSLVTRMQSLLGVVASILVRALESSPEARELLASVGEKAAQGL